MIIYKVRNVKTNEITNQWNSDFADEHYYESAFGKQQRWSVEEPTDLLNILDSKIVIDREESIDENEEVIEEISHIEYLLPTEYAIEFEDVTTQIEQEKNNQEAEEYLKSTDWYVLRMMDVGTPIPDGIQVLRQNARNSIV